MVTLHQDRFWTLAPRARPEYRMAFRDAPIVLPRFGIDTTVRLAHFLAQVLHETAGLTVLIENLNYSPERLLVVWPSRFPTLEAARPYARNPRALANKVYGGRLGNLTAEDGWIFRGRGLLQITGRSNYQKVTDVIGVDFTVAPDKVLLPEHALEVAACMWHLRSANEAADTDDVAAVTKRINGGVIGLADRALWLEQTREVVA